MTAPERIWATVGAMKFGEDSYCQEYPRDDLPEYILHTRAALAASPLVQEIVAEAVKAEREACAKAVEKVRDGFVAKGPALGVSRTTIEAIRIVTSDLATAIRARGEG